jgi:FkbM family methyltransferase
VSQTFWNENAVTRGLARHSMGRKVLSAVGSRFLKKKLPSFDLLLDLEDRWGVSKYILKYGEYDAELCRLVKNLIPPKSVCIDIGANIGFWTNFLISECEASRVYSIEPEPANLNLFRQNIDLNSSSSKVELFANAVGDKPGQLSLFLSEDNAGDHQLYDSKEGRKQIQVDVKRVDDLVGQRQIDFIKMDVQGFEPYVVEGMLGILERNRDLILLTEFWPSGIKKAGSDPQKMLDRFSERGFKFFFVDPRLNALTQLKVDEIHLHIEEGHHIDLILSRRALV